MQPLTFFQPVLYALFIWWFTTGLIFVCYGRARFYRRLGFAVATLALAVALWGVFLTRQQTQPLFIYMSVTCGVVVWGWQTASYYLGFLTGPRPPATPRPRTQPERFRRAFSAGLFHELVVVAFALILISLTWNAANRWGLWVFLALWIMHSLAKLNVFLGVRNFRIEFLPQHMQHLDALLEKRAINPLLPPTVVAAASASLVLVYRGIAPGTAPGASAGYLLVGTLVGLGALEILLLVLPLPVALWGWSWRNLPEQSGGA
jgi:putative photosynthetic complex assembly protein 2